VKIFLLIVAAIGFVVGGICFLIRRIIKGGIRKGAEIAGAAAGKVGGQLGAKTIGKKVSAEIRTAEAPLKPFLGKVLIVELIAWFISALCALGALAIFIVDITMIGSLGMAYSHEDSNGRCNCVAECVYGAGTVDFSKTSYDERALWANGFYLTHDPYNAAAFMNYSLYVQSEGAFKSPATDTAKKLVPSSTIKWSEGTDYECTFGDYMGSSSYPIIFIHYSFGEYDANDCYIVTDGDGAQHAVYINTDFYRFKHEIYLKEKFQGQAFTITRAGEHTYIQSLLDATPCADYWSTAGVSADDWKLYPEVSALVGKFFCTTYDYARLHKAEDGTQTDYKTMVSEIAAYARWFYDGEAADGILSELSQNQYYAYAGQTADTSEGGYVFTPAYSADAVYKAYYESWVAEYGTSDESIADMMYYIMSDNKNLGVNTQCGVCHEVMARCEGAAWWMDYTGMFHFVENERVGFEYDEGNGGGGTKPPQPNTVGDIRPQAMEIAQEMMSPVAYHVSHGCQCTDRSGNIHQWYCCKGSYRSQLIPATFYACCGGGSTATAIYAGLTEPESINSGGYVPCPVDYTVAYDGAGSALNLIYADLPVGTILCGKTVTQNADGITSSSQHCTILVYKDDSTAYIAGFGSDRSIKNIAERGYSSSASLSGLANSEISDKAHIWIYTPNRQASGGGGGMEDIEGYANPTDIETGRFNLGELSGVDVGFRRFEGSWYTEIDGWTQGTSPARVESCTGNVNRGSSSGGWHSETFQYPLYTAPPYNYSDFSKVYFYDWNYSALDTKQWVEGTLDYWSISRDKLSINSSYDYTTDGYFTNSTALNSVATNYYSTHVSGSSGYSPVYMVGMPCMGANAPGGQPATDSYWEKYKAPSGMYDAGGFFNCAGSYVSSNTYNTPFMLVLKDNSSGEIFYAPGGYSDGSGHYFPWATGQSGRSVQGHTVSDINDPNATFNWPTVIGDSTPSLWQPLAANTAGGTPYYDYAHTNSTTRNYFGNDQSRVDAFCAEYGLPVTVVSPTTSTSTLYNYFKWIGENRARYEVNYMNGYANLNINTYKCEIPGATKALIHGGKYTCVGFLLCSLNTTSAAGASTGYEYDPNNPSPMPNTPSSGSRPTQFSSNLDCSKACSSDEVNGSTQKGTIVEDYFADRKMEIYLPYGYDASASTKYPVVILKQGNGVNPHPVYNNAKCNAQNFLDYHIANGDMEPIIFVSLQGEVAHGLMWCQNDADGNGKSNLRDLVSYLEDNYNISTNPKDRIVGGMSYGTIELRGCQQTDLELFGVVALPASYLSDAFIAKQCSSTRPSYLLAVLAGASDTSGCVTWANKAVSSMSTSGGTLFGQVMSQDGHDIAGATRDVMRIAEWYFAK